MTTIIKVNIVLLFLILCMRNSYAQTESKNIEAFGIELKATTVDPELNAFFCSFGEIPVFPGGLKGLFSFAQNNLYYPDSAITDNIQGRVELQFTVDTTGKVIDEIVINSLRTDLDNICLSMLRKMPLWIPGKLQGRAVPVSIHWTIKFTIVE